MVLKVFYQKANITMLEWGTLGKRGVWKEMLGNLAHTVWAGTRKVLGGNGGGGPHHRLSGRIELVGVPFLLKPITSHFV